MNVPDLFTVALIFVTALVCAVFTSVVTVWLNNRDAWQRGWHEGWNEHAQFEYDQIVGPETEREALELFNASGPEVADLIRYHTGRDTVADLRPYEHHPDE